ncbi:MAG TPA: hypothetical protein VIF09_27470 [Polyangiaceae bacterium]
MPSPALPRLFTLGAPLLLCACASACASAAPSSLPPAAPTPVALPPATPPFPPTRAGITDAVELLDPGAEPRRSILMRPSPGASRTVDFTFTNSTQVLGDAAARVRRPRIATKMHLVARMTLAEVTGGGATWTVAITTAEVLPFEGMSDEFLRGEDAAMAPVRGATGRFTVGAGGGADPVEVETAGLDEKSAASRTKMVTLVLAPFALRRPAVPVGTGARWRLAIEGGAQADCGLRPAGDVLFRCVGTSHQEGSNGSVDMDIQAEHHLDPASGIVTSTVTRSVVKMVAPGDDGQPVPMESHVEMRFDVR